MTSAKHTPQKIATFLASLSESGNVTRSAKAAGIERTYLYQLRRQDPAFATQWEEAEKIGVQALRDEAFRRAYGYHKPLVFQGRLTGETIEEYSDTLLIFLMKGLDPATFGDKQRLEHSGPDGAPVQIDDATAADKLAKLIALAQSRKAADESGLA